MNTIKALTAKLRQERENPAKPDEPLIVQPETPKTVNPEIKKEAHSPPVQRDIFLGVDNIIELIKNKKVEGKTKMLIRIDDEHTKLLNGIKLQLLDFNVTQFINFLIEDFSINHPELKTIIKNSLKNSLKDL
jgi:hypothetical protein